MAPSVKLGNQTILSVREQVTVRVERGPNVLVAHSSLYLKRVPTLVIMKAAAVCRSCRVSELVEGERTQPRGLDGWVHTRVRKLSYRRNPPFGDWNAHSPAGDSAR